MPMNNPHPNDIASLNERLRRAGVEPTMANRIELNKHLSRHADCHDDCRFCKMIFAVSRGEK